jgi:hypothetical protein
MFLKRGLITTHGTFTSFVVNERFDIAGTVALGLDTILANLIDVRRDAQRT